MDQIEHHVMGQMNAVLIPQKLLQSGKVLQRGELTDLTRHANV